MTTTSHSTLQEVIITDLWTHLAGLIAIAIGLGANRYLGTGFSSDTNLLFIIGGFAAMGLKLTNGTVAAVAAAAAEAVKSTAAAQAVNTLAVAAQAASTLAATQDRKLGIPVPDAIPPVVPPMVTP
jgi:hypothetical protein